MFDQSTFSFTQCKKFLKSCTKMDLFLISMFSAGLGMALYGLSLIILNSNQNLLVSASEGNALISSGSSTPQVVVEVAGAVYAPGIYTLEHGSRVGQALALAGNILESADIEYTTKQLNLAQPVSDGDKIFIPFLTENSTKSDSPSNSASENNTGSDASNKDNTGKVSLNNASKAELVQLPGIGDKRADSIIESRPYQSLTQLVEQEVLTQNLFDEVEKLIIL